MKKQLIEMYQENLLVCDNTKCNFKLKNPWPSKDEVDLAPFVDHPCPECGESLLTEDDYINALASLKVINFINKWFSWLTFFIPKSAEKAKMTIKTHKGIHTKVEKITSERCCGRCDGVNDLCVADQFCDKHNVEGCEDCFGKV